jgi:hypothetical protein
LPHPSPSSAQLIYEWIAPAGTMAFPMSVLARTHLPRRLLIRRPPPAQRQWQQPLPRPCGQWQWWGTLLRDHIIPKNTIINQGLPIAAQMSQTQTWGRPPRRCRRGALRRRGGSRTPALCRSARQAGCHVAQQTCGHTLASLSARRLGSGSSRISGAGAPESLGQ